jgi:hypothetical protein
VFWLLLLLLLGWFTFSWSPPVIRSNTFILALLTTLKISSLIYLLYCTLITPDHPHLVTRLCWIKSALDLLTASPVDQPHLSTSLTCRPASPGDQPHLVISLTWWLVSLGEYSHMVTTDQSNLVISLICWAVSPVDQSHVVKSLTWWSISFGLTGTLWPASPGDQPKTDDKPHMVNSLTWWPDSPGDYSLTYWPVSPAD